jgi:putative FmdB family regulatory protein
MPLYEYECKTCKHTFEKMVRFSETDQALQCPQCLSQDTRKQISLFASCGSNSNQSSPGSSKSCGGGGQFT